MRNISTVTQQCLTFIVTVSEFILLRVSASFVAILGRKDAYTLWSRVAVTHRSCIIARVFTVNIGEIRRIVFQNEIKGHIYCLFNPIPPCFLAFKCLNLIGRVIKIWYLSIENTFIVSDVNSPVDVNLPLFS